MVVRPARNAAWAWWTVSDWTRNGRRSNAFNADRLKSRAQTFTSRRVRPASGNAVRAKPISQSSVGLHGRSEPLCATDLFFDHLVAGGFGACDHVDLRPPRQWPNSN